MFERRSHAPIAIVPLFLATLAAPLAGPADALAGAWTRDAGGVFLKLGADHWGSRSRLDGDGERVGYAKGVHDAPGGGGYSASALRGYLEYGWRDGWTAVVAGSFERRSADYVLARLATDGLGDLELALRRRMLGGPVVASIQADLKLPTLYDDTESPALGTGKVDAGGRLLLGGSTASLYATAEAGWLSRGARADEMPFAFEAGWSPMDRLLLRGEVRGASSVGAAGSATAAVASVRFDPALASSRWISAGGGVVMRGAPLDLAVDVSHVLAGRNTLAGTRLGLSVWYER